MEELLRAIEELKRAYTASGVKSVKVELGKDTMIQVDGVQKQLPITNGDWLRGLSDEELAKNIYCQFDEYDAQQNCRKYESCYDCKLAWLRAEHKGVE